MALASIRVRSALDASKAIVELRLAPDDRIADVKRHIQRLAKRLALDQLLLTADSNQVLSDSQMLSEVGLEDGGDLLLVTSRAPVEVYEDELFKVCMSCDCDVWGNLESFGCWCTKPLRQLQEWQMEYILEALPSSSWVSVQHVFESCLRSGRTKAANLLVRDERVTVHGRLLQDPVQDWFDDNDLCPHYFYELMDYSFVPERIEAAAGLMRVADVGLVRKCSGQPRSTQGSCSRKGNIVRTSTTDSQARVSLRQEGRRHTLRRRRALLDKSFDQGVR